MRNKVFKIVLTTEMVLIAGLSIANIVVKVTSLSNRGTPEQATVDGASGDVASDGIGTVTKEEAIQIVQTSSDGNRQVESGLLSEALRLREDEFSRTILYSYDEVTEVPEIALDSVMGLGVGSAEDFIIEEVTDYYVVISVDPAKISCGSDIAETVSCYRGISFNRQYLDSYEEVKENSHNDRIIFNNLSADFVELALKIIAATDIWNGSGLYDYQFEDNGESFVFRGIYFGVGLDMDSLETGGVSGEDLSYVINIYQKELVLDKAMRTVSWAKYDSPYGESTTKVLRSIPLTDEELTAIMSAVYGVSGDLDF